jgi:hypothetical protein
MFGHLSFYVYSHIDLRAQIWATHSLAQLLLSIAIIDNLESYQECGKNAEHC